LNRRERILGELLRASRPIEMIAKELAEFEWDSDEELAILDRTHVIAMLTDYLGGRRSSAEVRAWAETIEGRDDIGISDEFHATLQHAIFQLANPELDHVLSPLLARKLVRELQA
jgi:hypothetical protein